MRSAPTAHSSTGTRRARRFKTDAADGGRGVSVPDDRVYSVRAEGHFSGVIRFARRLRRVSGTGTYCTHADCTTARFAQTAGLSEPGRYQPRPDGTARAHLSKDTDVLLHDSRKAASGLEPLWLQCPMTQGPISIDHRDRRPLPDQGLAFQDQDRVPALPGDPSFQGKRSLHQCSDLGRASARRLFQVELAGGQHHDRRLCAPAS